MGSDHFCGPPPFNYLFGTEKDIKVRDEAVVLFHAQEGGRYLFWKLRHEAGSQEGSGPGSGVPAMSYVSCR